MLLTGVALQNVRLHTSFTLPFTKETTVIVGSNASGKTTIIESVAFLATGTSFRAKKISELILFENELARIKGVVADGKEGTTQLEAIVTRGIVQGKKTQHRLFSVNGVRKRKAGFLGFFWAVAFRPEDMRLIEGSPSRRRGYLDTVLALTHPEYERALTIYEQTLVRRNKLLVAVRENMQPRTVLQYWNIQLLKTGELLQQHRKSFLGSCTTVTFPALFSVTYQPSIISEARMAEYAAKEVAAGHTLIGPHKDDFIVHLHSGGQDLQVDLFGSRGQQRLAVLWLKWCEIAYLRARHDNMTILLLDDIFSELDDVSKALVLKIVPTMQTIITTTEPSVVDYIQQHVGEVQVVALEAGVTRPQ